MNNQRDMEERHATIRASLDSSDGQKSKGKKMPKEDAAKLNPVVQGKSAKRKRREDEDEKTKAERRAAYRLSASKYRKRQKDLVSDLHKTLAFVEKDNSELRNTNNELKAQLNLALEENQRLKYQHASAYPQGMPTVSAGSQEANPNVLFQAVAPPPPSAIIGVNRYIDPQNSLMAASAALQPSTVGFQTSNMNNFGNITNNSQIISSIHGNFGQNSFQIPVNMPTLDGQLQQYPTSLLTGTAPQNGSQDAGNAHQHFLATIQSPFAAPSSGSTTGHNAVSSLATQTMAHSTNASFETRNNFIDQHGNFRGYPPHGAP